MAHEVPRRGPGRPHAESQQSVGRAPALRHKAPFGRPEYSLHGACMQSAGGLQPARLKTARGQQTAYTRRASHKQTGRWGSVDPQQPACRASTSVRVTDCASTATRSDQWSQIGPGRHLLRA